MKQINDRLFAVDLNSQYNIDMLLLNSACYIVCNNKSDTNEAKQIATYTLQKTNIEGAVGEGILLLKEMKLINM